MTDHRSRTNVVVLGGGWWVTPIEEAACTSPLWLLRREARRPGSAFWLEAGRRSSRPQPPRLPRTEVAQEAFGSTS